jgi:hypothetical protein
VKKKDDRFVFKFFCPQAGLALPFPFDEKEAIPRPRDVKTNPPPGVLTALSLASIEEKLNLMNTISIEYLIRNPLQCNVFVPPKEKKREEN